MSFIPEGWTGVYWDVGSFHRATPPILSHILFASFCGGDISTHLELSPCSISVGSVGAGICGGCVAEVKMETSELPDPIDTLAGAIGTGATGAGEDLAFSYFRQTLPQCLMPIAWS
jgi:hypothetical protein